MFKPVGSFVLIAFFAFAFSVSAGAQANARRIGPAGPVARSAVAATQNADCQAPATVGEDYHGLSCEGTMVNLSAVPAPFYSIGEDFSGPEIIARPKDDPAVALRLEQIPERAAQAAPRSN